MKHLWAPAPIVTCEVDRRLQAADRTRPRRHRAVMCKPSSSTSDNNKARSEKRAVATNQRAFSRSRQGRLVGMRSASTLAG